MEQVLIIALVVVLIFGGLVVYSISGSDKEYRPQGGTCHYDMLSPLDWGGGYPLYDPPSPRIPPIYPCQNVSLPLQYRKCSKKIFGKKMTLFGLLIVYEISY